MSTGSFSETNNILNVVAGADLSGSQYLGVKLNSSGEAVVVGADGEPGNAAEGFIGILRNEPELGDMCEVNTIGGGSLGVAGGTIAAGKKVTTDANGKFVVTDAADELAIGIALEAASLDTKFAILLQTHLVT